MALQVYKPAAQPVSIQEARIGRALALTPGALSTLERALEDLAEQNGPRERFDLSAALYTLTETVSRVLTAAYPGRQCWPATPVPFRAEGDLNNPHPDL